MINDKIFGFIYGLALRDATIRVTESGVKDKLLKNVKIKELVKHYAEDIIEGKEPDFYKVAQNIESNKDGVKITFGNIQKLLNMTMKYLYIKYYDDADVRRYFRVCHAPLDGIMRDFVYTKYKDLFGKAPKYRKSMSWSTLELGNKDYIESYKQFQQAVRDIINESKLNMIPIELDYVAWKNDPKEELKNFNE